MRPAPVSKHALGAGFKGRRTRRVRERRKEENKNKKVKSDRCLRYHQQGVSSKFNVEIGADTTGAKRQTRQRSQTLRQGSVQRWANDGAGSQK